MCPSTWQIEAIDNARANGYTDTMTINRLRWIRNKNHISQKMLADCIGVSQNKISLLEKGQLKIGIPKLYKLAQAVGYTSDPHELLDVITLEEVQK